MAKGKFDVLADIIKEMLSRRDEAEKVAQFHALEAIKAIDDPKQHKESEDVAKRYLEAVQFWNIAIEVVRRSGATHGGG